jgi:predicted DNA-binding transcriptional regulator YafY
MDRTGRLYALVEELRAAAPHPVTVAALAARFEVSRRSVQRDLQALLEAGVPVRSTAGRRGGWSIDPEMTLPPLRLTPAEASALAVALADASGPYAAAARSAYLKIAASLRGPAVEAARDLTTRIVALPAGDDTAVRAAIEQALTAHLVLHLRYADAMDRETEREVEPAGLLTAGGRWYLIAWCRSRRAPRGFRLDRVLAARSTGEPAPPRAVADLLDSAARGAYRPI